MKDSTFYSSLNVDVHVHAFDVSGFFFPDCDLSFPENKLVSLNHCEITRNGEGDSFLEDTRFAKK